MSSDTAIIMIDMHNTYLADDGFRERMGYPAIWRLEETIEQCRLMMEAARAQGIPIIYTRSVKRKDRADYLPRIETVLSRALDGWTGRGPEYELWKRELIADVAPQDGDYVVDKGRWCSFTHTELEPILKNLGISRLIVAGLQTNVCVETTVRSALMKNYIVAVPEDAVSTDGEDLHHNSLKAMKILYTEVAPWRELLDPSIPWTRATDDPHYGRG
ncbi:MAG: isochorismatase family cysteine hydrolase [Microbacteriaceae bacterium]